MRILITGGDGFIGSHLVPHLEQRSHEVIATLEDIRTPEIADRIGHELPQVVVHLAAEASVPRSMADPVGTYLTNIAGTAMIAAACLAHDVDHVVFTSSGGTIYDPAVDPPYSEGDNLHALSPYGRSKIAGELLLADILHPQQPTILRLGNVYGPGDTRGAIAKLLTQRDRFQVNGDGTQTRDYIWIHDVIDAITTAIERRIRGTFNLGTGQPTSLLQLIQQLELHPQIPPAGTPPPPGEPRHIALNSDRARRHLRDDLEWTPLEAGLHHLLTREGAHP